MKRKSVFTLVALMLLTALAVGEMQEQYLDVFYCQVKPEKRAEFDAISKKMVAANRKNGDEWVALETVYGQGNRVTFISMRGSYADIDKALVAFNGSIVSFQAIRFPDGRFPTGANRSSGVAETPGGRSITSRVN